MSWRQVRVMRQICVMAAGSCHRGRSVSWRKACVSWRQVRVMAAGPYHGGRSMSWSKVCVMEVGPCHGDRSVNICFTTTYN